MIHKLLAGKGRMKKGLSLLLCLALLGSSVISANVTAEAESGVTVEAVEIAETDEAEAAETADEAETAETSDEATVAEMAEEATETETAEEAETVETTAEEVAETETTEGSGTAEITDETTKAENAEEPEAADEEDVMTSEETDDSSNAVKIADESTNTDSSDESDESSSTTDQDADDTTDDSGDSSAADNIGIYSAEGAVAVTSLESTASVAGSEEDTDTLTASSKAGGDNKPSEGDTTKEKAQTVTIKVGDTQTLSYQSGGMGGNYSISSITETSGSDYITVSDSEGNSSLTITGVSAGTAEVVVVYTSTRSNSDGSTTTTTVTVTYTITVRAGDINVYWDTITTTTNASTGKVTKIEAKNSETGVSSVTITGGSATNNGSVTHENGTATSWTSSTTELTYTTTNADNSDNTTVTVTITPETGYYVTFVAVCCCASGKPEQCSTFGDGNAYTGTFSVSSAGTISIDVYLNRNEGFHHSSNDSEYFIMIAVAKIPSPLYVEYDYGDIVDLIDDSSDDSAFSTAEGWTTTSDRNYYGNGVSDTNADYTYQNGEYTGYGVMTDDTQYKYAYDSSGDVTAADWTHVANTITTEAKQQAAAAGYVFAGWKAEYYSSVSVSANIDKDESGYKNNYNNWDYTFTSLYGSTTYGEGDTVSLTTNVRLIAQWIPIGIQIEKTVSGLPDGITEAANYTIALQDENGNTVGSAYTASIAGNGTDKNDDTVYLVASGTYQVVETNKPSTITYEGTTYYLVTYSGESIEITVPEESDDEDGYTVQTVTIDDEETEVAVLNKVLAYRNVYSESDNYIIVQKTFVGLDADEISDGFTVSVKNDSGTTYILSYEGDYWLEDITDDDGNVVWRWKIIGAELGSYTVSEGGTTVEGYTLLGTSGLGEVTVSAAQFDVSFPNGVINEKNERTYPVNIDDDTSTFFAALLANNDVLVITKTSLSASQKETIKNAVQNLSNGNWSNGQVLFYSIDDATEIYVQGQLVTYSLNEETGLGQITFTEQSIWTKVATGTYSISQAASNPEISITNTYTPDTTTLTVSKSVTGNMGDTTKDFTFMLTLTKGSDSYLESLPVEHTGDDTLTELTCDSVSYSFTLKDSESITITVPVGYTYTLTESNANGYTTYIDDSEEASVERSVSGELQADSETTVSYKNDYDIDPETGLNLDSLPYLLMLAGVAVLGGVVLFGRRRRLL